MQFDVPPRLARALWRNTGIVAYKAVKLMKDRHHVPGSLIGSIQAYGQRLAEVEGIVIRHRNISSCVYGDTESIRAAHLAGGRYSVPEDNGIQLCRV